MQRLEAVSMLVIVPACSITGVLGAALTIRVTLHKSMRTHLINRCILALSSIDLLYLTAALVHSALCAESVLAGEHEDDGGVVIATGIRRFLLPSLARASLLVIVVISAERFCAVRKPRHLQAGNSRKSTVHAALSLVAAAPFVFYGLEFAAGASRQFVDSSTNSTSVRVDLTPAAVAFAAADACLRGLPLLSILLLNLGIVRLLRESFRQRERLLSGFLGIQRALIRPGHLPPNAQTVLQRQRKTTCMLVYMSTFHLLLLVPAILLSALARVRALLPGALPWFAPSAGHRELSSLVVALEAASCSFNFAVYIRQSEKFRNVFLGLFAPGCAERGAA